MTDVSTRRVHADIRQSVRFAAGMALIGTVHVVVQILLFVEDMVSRASLSSGLRRGVWP